MAVTITQLEDSAGNPAVVTAGDDFSVTITVQKDSATYDVTGATITCSIREQGQSKDLIADHAVTITTAASGIVTLTLTDTETLSLSVPSHERPDRTVTHIADVKVVESGGDILHCGPFKFEVRRAVT